MAADSRGLVRDASSGAQISRDDWCKVFAPNKEFIFVAANILGYGGDEAAKAWTTEDIIRAAAKKIDAERGQHHFREIAEEWGDETSRRLLDFYTAHPQDIKNTATQNKGVLTLAFIGGLAPQGKLELYETKVRFIDGESPEFRASTSQVTCPHSLCAIGQTAIFTEFVIRRVLGP
jgi:hypothetical protein